MAWLRRLTWAAVLATTVTAPLAFWLAALARSWSAATLAAATLPLAGIPVIAAVAVARRQRANPLAVLIALPGLAAGLAICAALGDQAAAATHTRLPGQAYVTAASQGAWVLVYVVLAAPLLFFPTGRLETRATRGLLALILTVAGVFMVVAATAPGPYLPPDQNSPHVFGTMPAPLAGVLTAISLPGLPLSLIALIWQLVRRYRAGDGPRRRQFRWLSLVGALLPVTLLLTWLSWAVTGNGQVVLVVGLGTVYLGLPILIAVALLRPDLFDVDRVLATTVTHTVFTGLLLSVFTVVDLVAGLVVGRRAPTVGAVAAAVVAVVLAPARAHVQTRIDRWFYPARKAAHSAIERLHRDSLAGRARPEDLQDRLRVALRDPTLRVLYCRPSDDAWMDGGSSRVTGAEAAAEPQAAITAGAERIGIIAARTGTPVELLRDVAGRAAPLAELVRLRIDLRHVLREVEESRGRILRAGYDERVRLERDLHDGAQQRLVSLGMTLRLAQRRLERGIDVSGMLDSAVAEVATSVMELRQLAHGIRPSCLDDGLVPALSSLVSSTPIPITLRVQEIDLDLALETTAYYVAAEAITNAVRHARADNIALDVAVNAGELRVRISDDGSGVAAARAGSGLAGLADRVGAHGGRLVIDSGAGAGTTIEAILPCASS